MNKKLYRQIRTAGGLFLGLLMGIQIVLSLLWMFRNAGVMSVFGDSNEYLQLSETLILDEYRPILYPLILRGMRGIGELVHIPVQTVTYLFQTAVSLICLFYSVRVLDKAITGRKGSFGRIGFQLYFTLFLHSIPMITFMNFSILTDSLATSMLLLFLSGMVIMFCEENPPAWNYIVMALAFMAECLLRADRLYSCLLLAVVVFLVKLVKSRRKKQVLLPMLCICALAPGIVKGIDYVTQTPGVHGRIQTNLDFILLDRIVWPNMAANYGSFPQEIKDVITRKEAKTFDKHNNNVMYQMAPLLEERVGKGQAEKYYREMAGIVLHNQPGKVAADIGEDILAMVFTPVSSYLNYRGLCQKGDDWNVQCMSEKTPALTRNYNLYYQYLFMLMLVWGIVQCLVRALQKTEVSMKKILGALLPYIGMGVIFTLWFCLGDGAPPNDRYAMLIYITWGIVVSGLCGIWRSEY